MKCVKCGAEAKWIEPEPCDKCGLAEEPYWTASCDCNAAMLCEEMREGLVRYETAHGAINILKRGLERS